MIVGPIDSDRLSFVSTGKKGGESAGGYRVRGVTLKPQKQAANFARPSSVSADMPSFFKVSFFLEARCLEAHLVCTNT